MDTIDCEHGGTVARTQQRRPLLAFALLTTCAIVVNALPLMANMEAKGTTTTTLGASAKSIGSGTKLTLTATVSPSKATGSVTFYSGKQVIGKSALSGGNAKFSLSTLAVGSHVLEAVYGGSTTYGTSKSKTVTVVVTNPPTTTELSSPDPSGTSVTLIAKVSPSKATGQVVFFIDYPRSPFNVGTAMLIGGIAKVPTPLGIPTGKQEVTAVYFGSADWASSISNTITVTIK